MLIFKHLISKRLFKHLKKKKKKKKHVTLYNANESVPSAPALTASTAFNLFWALIQHQTNTSTLCSN